MNETLKLALEALEEQVRMANGWTSPAEAKAIAAIKEALDTSLAQPEHSAPHGEPVAWRETYSKVIKTLAAIVNVHTPDKLFDLDAIPRDPVMHLVQQIKAAIDGYKPPQRTWVGLTPDDFRQLEKETTVNGYNGDYCPTWDLIEAVEEKLKQKNGYAEEKNT